jgi:hypothetical protein
MPMPKASVNPDIRGRWPQERLWDFARPLVYFAVAAGISLFAGRGAQQFIYFQF